MKQMLFHLALLLVWCVAHAVAMRPSEMRRRNYNAHLSSESALSSSGFSRNTDGRIVAGSNPSFGPGVLGEGEGEDRFFVSEDSLVESNSLVYDIGDHKIGMSSTAIAILGGDVEALELLVQAGVDIDMRSSDGWTPLMYAAKAGSEDVVEYILDQGANARLLSDAKESAFSIAVGEDHRLIALMIADVNILQAMRANDPEGILAMVRAGGHVNIANAAGWTPLIYMVNQGDIEGVTELVVTHKADVNKVENDGWSALMFASFHGYEDVVRLLIRHGADSALSSYRISEISGRKLTALSIATFRHHAEVVKILANYRPVAGLRARQFPIL
jgi:ankyrin repeat protein